MQAKPSQTWNLELWPQFGSWMFSNHDIDGEITVAIDLLIKERIFPLWAILMQSLTNSGTTLTLFRKRHRCFLNVLQKIRMGINAKRARGISKGTSPCVLDRAIDSIPIQHFKPLGIHAGVRWLLLSFAALDWSIVSLVWWIVRQGDGWPQSSTQSVTRDLINFQP